MGVARSQDVGGVEGIRRLRRTDVRGLDRNGAWPRAAGGRGPGERLRLMTSRDGAGLVRANVHNSTERATGVIRTKHSQPISVEDGLKPAFQKGIRAAMKPIGYSSTNDWHEDKFNRTQQTPAGSW